MPPVSPTTRPDTDSVGAAPQIHTQLNRQSLSLAPHAKAPKAEHDTVKTAIVNIR